MVRHTCTHKSMCRMFLWKKCSGRNDVTMYGTGETSAVWETGRVKDKECVKEKEKRKNINFFLKIFTSKATNAQYLYINYTLRYGIKINFRS